MNQPRIILADDHVEVLKALRFLLKDSADVIGTVTDGSVLIETAQRLKPDIIIADISMPGLNGLEATRVLRRCLPESKVIILTVHRAAVYASLAFDAGACGYVIKRSAVAELPQAILHVLAGDRYIGQGVDTQHAWAEPLAKRL